MNLQDKRLREHIRSCKPNRPAALAAALALALATLGGGAQAATQTVSNCSDSGSGSLRAAITAAMSGDLIDATGLACSTISLSTGALAVTVDDLDVRGAGRDHLKVTNGAKYGRVFRHEGAGLLRLSGMTITGGVVSPAGTEAGTRGGCIYSKGTVTLGNVFDVTDRASGVVVDDCAAISTQAGVGARGGGIYAKSGVGLANSTVTHSRTIAQDQATRSDGGGITVSQGPFAMKYSEVRDCSASGPIGNAGGISAAFVETVTVKHSTIAGNSATGRAGGAYLGTSSGGLVLIDNSTISGNSSAGEGGLVSNTLSSGTPGAIHVYSSTITGNETTDTNFVFAGASLSGPTVLRNTIASGNFAADMGYAYDLNIDPGTTGANNLIGNIFRTPPALAFVFATNPKLGPLTNRGGPTRTHEPLADSPAIDAGDDSSGSGTDQRGPGFPRTLGARTDIGAVERNPDTIFANGFD